MGKVNYGDIDRFILFGGEKFLLHTATQLIQKGFEVIVFSDERHLTGEVDGSTLFEQLKNSNITFYESDNINGDPRVSQYISSRTMGLSLGATWIFKDEIINQFAGRLINMHGTRLPQNRGGGGFSWQILRQNRLGYSLLHLVDKGVDTGDIVKYKEYIFPASCKIPADFLAYHNTQDLIFIEEFIDSIKNQSDFELMAQPEYLSIYWPRLNTYNHAFIDWNWNLRDIELFIDAFDDPYMGASTFLNEKRVYLKDCCADYNEGHFHPFQSGMVYRKGEGIIFIAAREGSLIIKDIITEDGRNIIESINIGDRFFTPLKYLESAKLFRAVYTTKGLKKD